MKYNIKISLLLIFIFVFAFNGKIAATNYSFTAATGTFGVLTTSYVGYMSNTYTINTSTSSTILLMYTADKDPSDYLLISTVDANNNIVTSKVVSDASGIYTTTLANGRALVTFYSDATGHYSDMGYRGFTIQYSTTSSLSQAQVFSYNGSTVLTGKVGIGTYSPGYALDVSGSTNVSNDLFANGKIGVGTQAPVTLLNVVGTTDVSPTTPGLFVLGATNTTNIGFDQNEIMARTNGVASTLYINHEGGNVVFNGTNTASANVGIGTSTPVRRLDIRGVDNGTPQIRLSGSAAPQYYWEFGEESLSTGDFFLDYMGSSGLKHPLRIKTNGYIGIGTTNPDALLTVNGTIHAKEVKIDLSGSFADYVFEKNYALKPLSEVHLYIKDNGHLPEIPSADEVNKNGINVADMQVKLLKKIEELTLYAIQQQEKSLDQQKRIEALEKELRQVKNK